MLRVQPSNEDKEPIRHLYRRYAELKDAIAELEAEVRCAQAGVGRYALIGTCECVCRRRWHSQVLRVAGRRPVKSACLLPL